MSADAPPDQDPRPERLRHARSLVLVNTGAGKGKSTAAFGVMMRALGRDWPVAVIQFLKSGSWNTGEEKLARKLGVYWLSAGEGFTWESEDLSEDEAAAVHGWQRASELLDEGTHRLVVLDEITYPMNWGWVSTVDVVAKIANRSPRVNVIATGRDAPPELIELADTVTEMREVKHAYGAGIGALAGIDY